MKKQPGIKTKSKSDILRIGTRTKRLLFNRLKKQNLFWSYDKDSLSKVSDREIIEKVMLYGDLKELKTLLSLYSTRFLRKEWRHVFSNNSAQRQAGKFVNAFLFNGKGQL